MSETRTHTSGYYLKSHKEITKHDIITLCNLLNIEFEK